MRAPMPNQALEPTLTRVSVLNMAALISSTVSGLGGSVHRWAMKAIAVLFVCICLEVVAQKPPQDGAPNVSPSALASLQHELTQQQVEEQLKARGNHQFTAAFTNGVARCLSYYRNDVYGHYYLVFTNDHLARVCQPPPFELREEPYRGTRAIRRVLGDPEARVAAALAAEDMIGPRLSAALKPQTPSKRSVDPGLTAAFLLAQKLAGATSQAERERKYHALVKQYDPFEVVLGAALTSVEGRLGKPHVTEPLESGREIRYYGNIEFGLSASREQMWLAVVYEDGKVVRVYSRDFVDHDKIRPIE
jgi:hypothetical protein